MSKKVGETIYTCDGCGVHASENSEEIVSWRSFNFSFGDGVHAHTGNNPIRRELCPDCVHRAAEFLIRVLPKEPN